MKAFMLLCYYALRQEMQKKVLGFSFCFYPIFLQLIWPNTVFAHAFAESDAIQHMHKDCNKQR